MSGPAERLAGAWLELRIVPVLLWSISGVTLGTALTGADGPIELRWWLAAISIGVLLQGVVAHCVNEVVDWRSGTDRHPAPRVLSGGSKVLRAGLLQERHLIVGAIVGSLAAIGLGVWIASARGWWLLTLGAVGLAGAILYTAAPARAAYRPYLGEGIAFACVVACVIGGDAVQRGSVTWTAVLVGAAHGAYCVSMLMLHHQLDREPDASATPPKRTSIVASPGSARAYSAAWAAGSTAAWTAAVIAVDRSFAPCLLASAVALGLQLVTDRTDPRSVTRAESLVIAMGIAAAFASATIAESRLGWTALLPLTAILVEGIVQARWLRPRLVDPAPTGQA